MKRFLVPMAGSVWVLAVGLTLLIVSTVRPWGGVNNNWDTYFGYRSGVPQGYERSVVSMVDMAPIAPPGWVVHPGVTGPNEGEVLFVARGCASCHGIDANGAGAGPSLLGASQRAITRMVRNGNGGMPVYSASDLSDNDLALITGYITSLGPAPTPVVPVVTPTATPWPSPTPIPTATPMPTPTLVPGVTPSPTPTAQPTVPPTPTPTINGGDVAAGHQLFSDVGCSTCHGLDAKGTTYGPALAGVTADQVQNAVRNGQSNANTKYPQAMAPFSRTDVTDAELQQIIQYLLSLQ